MSKRIIPLLFILALCAFGGVVVFNPVSSGATAHIRIDTFNADNNWTAPSGVTSVTVEGCGGGGGGTTGTGGGGGGEYCTSALTVVPSTVYAVVAGTSTANVDGEDSTFNSTSLVASGGLSGANGGTGGTGGTGDTCRDGGDGTIDTGNSGGGGGAGTTAVGNDAITSTGGLPAAFYGGSGGIAANVARAFCGGGMSTAASQGIGTNGYIKVKYEIDPGAGFPRVIGRSLGGNASDSTSHSINLPSCISGNLLLVAASIDALPTVSNYTGWTNLNETDSTQNTGIVLYKTSTGSDTLSLTTSVAQESMHFSFCIEGATGAPEATAGTGNGTNSDPPSEIYSGGSGNHYWMTFRMGDLSAGISSPNVNVSAPPSGHYDFEYLPALSFGNGADIAVSGLHSATDTLDPGAYTSGNEQYVVVTVIIPGT